ncbi:MAG: STAS domain-containing protein [Thermoguttaceae bacterium]
MATAATGCKLDVDRGPQWLLVKVSGFQADPAHPLPLADLLWAVAQRHFCYRLVLDLEEVPLDSHLLGQLTQLYELIQEHEGVLRLCGLSPQNRRIVQRCALADRFQAYQTREEAVLGGCGDPRLPR